MKSSAAPPPTQNLTKRLIMPVTTATKATRTTPPTLEDLAATPTVRTAHVVEMARVIATTTPAVLTAAQGRDWLTSPPLLTIPQRPLLGHPGPPLQSHQHRPPQPPCLQLGHPLTVTRRPTRTAITHQARLHPRGRVLVRMATTRRASPHPWERVLVPNDMWAPCPHRSLHLALQPLRPLSAASPPLR